MRPKLDAIDGSVAAPGTTGAPGPPFRGACGRVCLDGLSDAARLAAAPAAIIATVVKNTCQFVVGRLLELRVAAGYRSVADVDDMIGIIRAEIGKLDPVVKCVIAADWRAVRVMRPETADRVRVMLLTMNPRVIRSAILTLPVNPTTNLQVVRLVHEAENANRKHFTSPLALHQWLSEVLTKQEWERLRVFLGTTSAAA
jgi:hypothetical protein